jgi:hypothetical protein
VSNTSGESYRAWVEVRARVLDHDPLADGDRHTSAAGVFLPGSAAAASRTAVMKSAGRSMWKVPG